MLDDTIKKLYSGQTLNTSDMEEIFNEIMTGNMDDIVISSVLTVLRMRGETAEEISGAAKSVLAHAKPFPRPDYEFGDIVGTGGDPYNTINISSISTIVAGGCGAKICKHGNRKVTSLAGSADLLSNLGMDLDATPEQSRALLDKHNVCFVMAPNYHSSIRHVIKVRQTLKTATIFNILGPLLNPARPDYILNGVYQRDLLPTIASAHKYLGLKAGAMVHGSGLDEVALHGQTSVVELKDDGDIVAYELSPVDFGLPEQSMEDIEGGNVEQNTQMALAVIDGTAPTAHENAVAANVALYLRVAGIEPDLKKGVDMAKQSIHNGSAKKVLQGITA